MFEIISPEEAGISSASIAEYIDFLNHIEASTHGILMMKGNKIFEETYWSPFSQEKGHRMYSQTKSLVGIAIGLLEEEGKLTLDDKAIEYFTDKIDSPVHPWLQQQTIREMLTMTTVGEGAWWFGEEDQDRVHLYFNRSQVLRQSGTVWEYDSQATQVLSSLVERLSGMSLLDYMKMKIFNKMGTFQNAVILKTPNGDSWGDSALICTLRDIASFGRLLMQGGEWNGEQLINRDYVSIATSAVVDNSSSSWKKAFSHGYGYFIWRTEQNGFAFVGMGDQITICLPEKDLLFSIISDNQGSPHIKELFIQAFFSMIVNKMESTAKKKNKEDFDKLQVLNRSQKLIAHCGKKHSCREKQIDGKTFFSQHNNLGIKWVRFSFDKDGEGGVFCFENAQGEKTIPFGLNQNKFGVFPQLGYSNEVGMIKTTNGFCYQDAVSACWRQDNRLHIYVQIIDRYLGNLMMTFSFRDNNVYCRFEKNAEAFLDEYNGSFIAEANGLNNIQDE